MTETWLQGCTIRFGPPGKQGYSFAGSRSLGEIEGSVLHSAEGGLAALIGELDKVDRRASWHFSVAKNGTVYQHYPLESVCWHCGVAGDRFLDTSLIGNATLVGIEHEGGGPNAPGEPLTEPQYQATLRLSRDIRALCPHVGASPPMRRRNLWEHRELSQTSCPSGRIPWARLLADLAGQEDDMDANLETKLKAIFTEPFSDPNIIDSATGQPVLWPSQWAFVMAHTVSFDAHRIVWLAGKA